MLGCSRDSVGLSRQGSSAGSVPRSALAQPGCSSPFSFSSILLPLPFLLLFPLLSLPPPSTPGIRQTPVLPGHSCGPQGWAGGSGPPGLAQPPARSHLQCPSASSLTQNLALIWAASMGFPGEGACDHWDGHPLVVYLLPQLPDAAWCPLGVIRDIHNGLECCPRSSWRGSCLREA